MTVRDAYLICNFYVQILITEWCHMYSARGNSNKYQYMIGKENIYPRDHLPT